MNLTDTDILDIADEIPGWMRAGELRWLVKKARQLKPGSCWAELGSYCGRSLMAVGLALPPGCLLVSVDQHWGLYDGTESKTRKGRKDIKHTLADTHNIIQRRRNGEITNGMIDVWDSKELANIKLQGVCSSTSEAANIFKLDLFDVVFIDADHSYESCRKDIKNWIPLIKDQGIICGHDYAEGFGVLKAVDSIFPSVRKLDTIWEVSVTREIKNNC